MTIAVAARTAFRLTRVAIHVAWGVALVRFAYPWCSAQRRLSLKRRWSAQLLAIVGVRLSVSGERASHVSLVVANHISWLDVFVINAMAPHSFVCKADVRDWPVIGWLCARNDTVFLARGRAQAARQTVEHLAKLLQHGRTSVAVFPEGTTTDGRHVLPFRAALLQSAIDAGAPVQPFALAYYDDTLHGVSDAPRYDGAITLWQSLLRLCGERRTVAAVRVLPPIDAARCGRRELADEAESRIRGALSERMKRRNFHASAKPLPVADIRRRHSSEARFSVAPIRTCDDGPARRRDAQWSS